MGIYPTVVQDVDVVIRRAHQVRTRLMRTERAAVRLREEWEDHRKRLQAAARRATRQPAIRR